MKLLGVAVFILITSCGKIPEINYDKWSEEYSQFEIASVAKEADSVAYSYELFDQGCTTDLHEFYNINDICENLLNDEINNNCAKGKRARLHESQCLLLE